MRHRSGRGGGFAVCDCWATNVVRIPRPVRPLATLGERSRHSPTAAIGRGARARRCGASRLSGATQGGCLGALSAIYDEVGPDDSEGWNFAPENETAPHYPLAIRWNRGWFGLPSLHQRLGDADGVRAVFGPLLDHIERLLVRETMA